MKIEKGIDGNIYAVFASESDAEEYSELFKDFPLTCFGGYYNAYRLTDF